MRVYAALLASLVACRLALADTPINYKTPGQELMLQWWFLAVIAGYGAVGVVLARKVEFGMDTTTKGAVVAIAHGVAVGLVTIAMDVVKPERQEHHPLPEGLLVYWYGGVVSEIWFHLLPVPLVIFLAGKRAFWPATLLLALWEGRGIGVAYAANVSEIWLFRRYGFMTAIIQRMAGYALWHIAWPLMQG